MTTSLSFLEPDGLNTHMQQSRSEYPYTGKLPSLLSAFQYWLIRLVNRIPMPEGLTPLALPTFNCQLDNLIQNYTIRGKPILVHCRGGVGRAGLVACCWMLKLGLCGWLPDNGTGEGDMLEGQVRKGTMELVERAILVARRRRSVKAIETYEQVRFLVDYVEFLRNVGGRDPRSS